MVAFLYFVIHKPPANLERTIIIETMRNRPRPGDAIKLNKNPNKFKGKETPQYISLLKIFGISVMMLIMTVTFVPWKHFNSFATKYIHAQFKYVYPIIDLGPINAALFNKSIGANAENKTLMFMHIPKTGGSTIRTVAYKHQIYWSMKLFATFFRELIQKK